MIVDLRVLFLQLHLRRWDPSPVCAKPDMPDHAGLPVKARRRLLRAACWFIPHGSCYPGCLGPCSSAVRLAAP